MAGESGILPDDTTGQSAVTCVFWRSFYVQRTWGTTLVVGNRLNIMAGWNNFKNSTSVGTLARGYTPSKFSWYVVEGAGRLATSFVGVLAVSLMTF